MQHAGDLIKLQTTIANGTCQDVWLQRTTVATAPMCPGGTAPWGPGGNCNNWYPQAVQPLDGEHLNICNMGGNITFDYKLDCDPVYDPMDPASHHDPLLPCDVMKPIPCCYEGCIP